MRGQTCGSIDVSTAMGCNFLPSPEQCNLRLYLALAENDSSSNPAGRRKQDSLFHQLKGGVESC